MMAFHLRWDAAEVRYKGRATNRIAGFRVDDHELMDRVLQNIVAKLRKADARESCAGSPKSPASDLEDIELAQDTEADSTVQGGQRPAHGIDTRSQRRYVERCRNVRQSKRCSASSGSHRLSQHGYGYKQ